MLNEVYNRRILELAGGIPRLGRLEKPVMVDPSAVEQQLKGLSIPGLDQSGGLPGLSAPGDLPGLSPPPGLAPPGLEPPKAP